jgi:sensor histidine kinase YesM
MLLLDLYLMKMNKELKYNLLFALILILVDETWDFSVQAIFSSPSEALNQLSFKGSLLMLTFSIAYFTVYTLNYLVFAPRFLNLKKIPHYVVAFFVMSLCFAAVRFFLEEVIGFAIFGEHNYNLQRDNIVAVYLMDSIGYSLKPCLYSSLMYLFFRYKENTELVNTLKLQQQKAQMSMLRSQIGPHFLFNTLNGFYSDLYDDKPQTANDILKLSKLLRYITYEVKESFMPLKQELDFIKNYLYFYQKRYEDEFFVTLKVEGTIDDRNIPSLVLIHFVENVCKHGVIDQQEKPALIEIKVTENHLIVTTTNSVNHSEKYMDKGIGTQNVKNRLELLFKDAYELTYGLEGDVFNTFLKIPA